MKIEEVDIDKITPDPDQPRTSIKETDLKEMAKSIITEGIINPIEVDKGFVIITGERRWRAARIAGLKTVPVKIISVNKEGRFMRQVIENLHNNTMSDWDTAHALKKLVDDELFRGAKQLGPPKEGRPDTGVTWLSEKTGKSPGYIEEKLSILKASKAVKKRIKEGTLSTRFLRAINRTPQQYREAVEKKILDNEFVGTDGAGALTSALIREELNPRVANALLAHDYSGYKTDHEVKMAVHKMSPTDDQMIEKSFEPSEELVKIVDALVEWMQDNPKKGIGSINAGVILANINGVFAAVGRWLKEEPELKQLN